MTSAWQNALRSHVDGNPISILRLNNEDWHALQSSRKGIGEFTIAVPHSDASQISGPTLCIIAADADGSQSMMIGAIGRPSAITTLQSRVKLKRVFRLSPSSLNELVDCVLSARHRAAIMEKFAERGQLVRLGPQSSRAFVDGMARIESNHIGLRSISASLSVPRRVRSNTALQEQSLRTALRAFGIAIDAKAETVELLSEDETAISRVQEDNETTSREPEDFVSARVARHVIEDGAIEHDARYVNGMDLVGSDATGRAVYYNKGERLEIITANRRPLEEAFGVDLIYINTVQNNIVMLQYKMLEKSGDRWIYRPNGQLQDEISRMQLFDRAGSGNGVEYRLHPGLFYMKFVKRDASLRQGGILLPLDHYTSYLASSPARGPHGGLRVDYDSLAGCYMREQPFVDLVRSGYIGSYCEDTKNLRLIIQSILDQGKAVVAAIQTLADRGRRS